MKNILFIAAFVLIGLSSCKTNSGVTPQERNSNVVAVRWKVDKFQADGKTLAVEGLKIEAIALYAMVYEFKSNGVVRATDKLSSDIKNQGTWALNADASMMDINIEGFTGSFTVEELKPKSMKLTAPATAAKTLIGMNTPVSIFFVPNE